MAKRRGGAVCLGGSARELGRAIGTNCLIMPSLFSSRALGPQGRSELKSS